MPKIIEVTYNYPCEVFIFRHVDALEKAGRPVQLVARHSDKKLLQSASIQISSSSHQNVMITPQFDHLKVTEKVASLRYLRENRRQPYSKLSIRDRVMLGFFEKINPDLIHFHFGSLAGIMSWIPIELRIPYTVSLRGSDVQVQPLISENGNLQIGRVLNEAAGIHTVSESLWRMAQPYLEKPAFHQTIYTTVPISGFSIEAKNNDKIMRFVTVGRLHWTKAYVNLLLGFKNYLEQGYDGQLTIIGDGPEYEGLVYWIHTLGLTSHVDLKGKLPPAEIQKCFKKANAFIQSSIAEGFSNATAEAMSFGLPVFATDVGGTSEIIRDGINGFLLDPIHPQDWYKKLRLVKDAKLMQKIGKNASETASEFFSAVRHAKEFIGFYSTILNGL